jgi:hypothetical protein
MKKTIFFAVVLMTAPALLYAQIEMNANQNPMYYTHTLANSKDFAASQIDTLPSPSASASTVIIGGARQISLSLSVTDTSAIDVYVDYRVRGTTTWTNALTDSLITQSAAGTKREYVLRNATTEKLPGTDIEIRTRIAFRASGVGVDGTRKYTARLNYIP